MKRDIPNILLFSGSISFSLFIFNAFIFKTIFGHTNIFNCMGYVLIFLICFVFTYYRQGQVIIDLKNQEYSFLNGLSLLRRKIELLRNQKHELIDLVVDNLSFELYKQLDDKQFDELVSWTDNRSISYSDRPVISHYSTSIFDMSFILLISMVFIDGLFFEITIYEVSFLEKISFTIYQIMVIFIVCFFYDKFTKKTNNYIDQFNIDYNLNESKIKDEYSREQTWYYEWLDLLKKQLPQYDVLPVFLRHCKEMNAIDNDFLS